MTETFTNSGIVKLKAGANVSTAITATQYTELINEAESYINTVTRVNYTDTYSTLNADVKKILDDAASSHAAVGAIQYDMSGYTSRAEAITILNSNYTRFQQAIAVLKDKQATDFINGA